MNQNQARVIRGVTQRFVDVDGVSFAVEAGGRRGVLLLTIRFLPVTESVHSYLSARTVLVRIGPRGGLRIVSDVSFGKSEPDTRYTPDVILRTFETTARITSNVCREPRVTT